MPDTQSPDVMEIRSLTKEYSSVKAINDVSFSIGRGTVHCLVGENGAGKSTLVKMLTGALRPTSGTMTVDGKAHAPNSPGDARKGGIATLFQELHVVNELTVKENLTLGMERSRFGFLANADLDETVVRALAAIEPSIDPQALVSTLSAAQKQIIEIARAVSSGASIIIMDEPTAALSEREVKRLFAVITRLRDSGVTVIYISHKLEEIFTLGDNVTVLRDGKHIVTKPLAEVKGHSELIELMIGRTVFQRYSSRQSTSDHAVLAVDRLTTRLLKDVSFQINKGEIVGFYGLVGSGKSEIARAVFGADKFTGSIQFKGQNVGRSPKESIAAGIALVPEERRTQGLFTSLSIRRNISVMNIGLVSNRGIFQPSSEKAAATEYVQKLNVATSSIEKATEKLSGGNQQKVVLAKCLFADSDLLLLDEPTRGVDIGAKAEIYEIIRRLADTGTSVAVFSSELEEVLGICDRIFLLYAGSLEAVINNGPDVDAAHMLRVVNGSQRRAEQ